MFRGGQWLKQLAGKNPYWIIKAAVGFDSSAKGRGARDSASMMFQLDSILMVSHDHLRPSLGRWCWLHACGRSSPLSCAVVAGTLECHGGSADGACCLEGHYSLGVVLSCLLSWDGVFWSNGFPLFSLGGKACAWMPIILVTWLEGWWIALGIELLGGAFFVFIGSGTVFESKCKTLRVSGN